MNNLVLAFLQFGKLSSVSLNELSKIVKEHYFPKGHILVAPDSVCRHFYFVDQGLARTFYLKEGKDITDWISPEGTFAVSLISYINQISDRRGIELLEPSVLYSLCHDDLEELCCKYHDIEHVGQIIVNHGIIQMQRKIDDTHFATAKQRYENLVANTPSIIQRVPLGMVASFLVVWTTFIPVSVKTRKLKVHDASFMDFALSIERSEISDNEKSSERLLKILADVKANKV